MSGAATDGGPDIGSGRIPPSLRALCQLRVYCESLMLSQYFALHAVVSQGQERGVSGVRNMKDKFVLGATDQEIIVQYQSLQTIAEELDVHI